MNLLHFSKYVVQLFLKLPLHHFIFKVCELVPVKNRLRCRRVDLPPEIVFMIFEHLSQADLFSTLLVSKKWASVAVIYLYSSPSPHSIHSLGSLFTVLGQDKSAMFNYIDFVFSLNLQFAHLPSLIRKVAKLFENLQLTSINLSNQNMEDRIVNQLLTSSKKIERICLNETGVRTLQFLSNNNTYLKSLELSKCIHITNNGLRNVGLNCQNLVYLNLSGSFLDDATLQQITENCVELKALDLSDCAHLTDHSFILLFLKPCADFISLSIPVMIVSINSLEIVANAHNDYVFKLKSITFTAHAFHPSKDDAISLFVSVFNTIESLSFNYCNITDAIFTAISLNCSELKQLKITYEPSPTSIQTQMYASNFSPGSLEKLCTKTITVEEEMMVVDSDIQLENLSLPFCHLLIQPINTLTKLLTLSLTSLILPSCGSIIDNEQIKAIVETCPNITMLDLSNAWKLTDDCIPHLLLLRLLHSINISVNQNSIKIN